MSSYGVYLMHCFDVKWVPMRLKSPVRRLFILQFVQANTKENTASLSFCEANPSIIGGFQWQRAVMRKVFSCYWCHLDMKAWARSGSKQYDVELWRRIKMSVFYNCTLYNTFSWNWIWHNIQYLLNRLISEMISMVCILPHIIHVFHDWHFYRLH